MQARLPFPRTSSRVPWLLAIFAAVCLGFDGASLLTKPTTDQATPLPAAGASLIAYFQFDDTADTLWLADPAQPDQRHSVLVAPHAAEFGVVPSLAPDGKRFVYAALPPETRNPTAATPAGLWLTSTSGEKPRLVVGGINLLIPAVWSPDGSSVVYRRSDSEAYRLLSLDLVSGQEQPLIQSTDAALFPVAFTSDGASLYYVRLSEAGSVLASLNLTSGSQREVALLSPGLTRDWSLSPDGSRLAYLAMDLAADQMSSRAAVLNIESGAIKPAGPAESDAFSPTWDAEGRLVLGHTGVKAAAGLVRLDGTGATTLPGPRRGFDVPLASSSSAGFAVRSFEGSSAAAPGRSVLAVVAPDGSRKTIATGEVTFLGWINP